MATRSTLNVSLTPELDAFVQDTVKSGRYQSASEVVRDALRRLQDEFDARQRAIDRFNAEVEIGCEQIRRGEVVDGETVFRELQRRISEYRAKSA